MISLFLCELVIEWIRQNSRSGGAGIIWDATTAVAVRSRVEKEDKGLIEFIILVLLNI